MLLPEGVLKPVLSQVGLAAEGERESVSAFFSLLEPLLACGVLTDTALSFFLNPAHYGFPLSREAETAEVTTE